MAEKKITIAEMYDKVRAVLVTAEADEELISFIDDRKAKSKKSSTKSKELDDGQKALIAEVERVLKESGIAMSITEMQKQSDVLKELTTSKISANIQKVLTNPIGKPINESGTIERSMDKKVARFTYVGAVDEDGEPTADDDVEEIEAEAE